MSLDVFIFISSKTQSELAQKQTTTQTRAKGLKMKKQDFAKIVTFDNSNYAKYGLYTLHDIFMAEKGKSFGLNVTSAEDWLRGLPSCLDYPFYDYDIKQKTGMMPARYWKKLAAYVFDLIKESKMEQVGIVSGIERIDTSYHGNPRYRFLLNTGDDVVMLQTEVDSHLGYAIPNYSERKVIVKTKFVRNKLCAINMETV